MLAQLPSKPLRLAYFGTPEIAEVILRALLDGGEDQVAIVVCQPDRPRGRGQKLEAPPTKRLAEERGIEVVQPEKMRDGALATRLRALDLDLSIVAAFGRILPDDVLGAAEAGAWNIHASLLPRHRGASPIQHAILAGDLETGVSLIRMTAGLDEGPILRMRSFAITPEETAASLTARLAALGGQVLLEGLATAKRVGLPVEAQDPRLATYAPLLKKGDGALDPHRPALELDRRIRAFNPWPGTFLRLSENESLKILSTRVVAGRSNLAPGTLIAEAGMLAIQTSAGALLLDQVQPAGKRPISGPDYLRGHGRRLQTA